MANQALINYLNANQQVLINHKNYNTIVHTYNTSRRTTVDLAIYNRNIKASGLILANSRIKANNLYKIYIESLKNQKPKLQQIQQQTPLPPYTVIESSQPNSDNDKLIILYQQEKEKNKNLEDENKKLKETISLQLIKIEGLKKDHDHYKNLYELQDILLKEAKKQIEDLKKIAKDYEDLKVDNAKIVEQLRLAEIRKKKLEDEVIRLQNENERIKNDLIRLRDDVRNILEIIKN